MKKRIFRFWFLTCCITMALLIQSSCTSFRVIKYGVPTIYDYEKFEQDTIKTSDDSFSFIEHPCDKSVFDTLKLDFYSARSDTFRQMTIKESLDYINRPSAVIIIKNDTILYEYYAGGLNRESQTTIFSVTKTITSLLCGVALKDGYIKSLDAPVTDFIPELKKADANFSKLTIEHLLDMNAGLDFKESYAWNPFSKMAKLYYGKNSLKTICGTTFINEPGEKYHYDSMTTAILGVVIERATGIPYAEYLSEKIWKPLGMEQPASVSLDSKKYRTAKSYAGITTNVRDLAKIGRLYLNKGNWNGVQIVDTAYVERSHSTHFVGSNNGTYSYCWYWGTTDYKCFSSQDDLYEYYKTNEPSIKIKGIKQNRETNLYTALLHRGGFWAYGLYGQVLYVNTEKNYIAVFLGADRIEDYYNVFDKLYDIF